KRDVFRVEKWGGDGPKAGSLIRVARPRANRYLNGKTRGNNKERVVLPRLVLAAVQPLFSFLRCGAWPEMDSFELNKILGGVVGDHVGEGRGGFNFSAAMKSKGGTWDFDALNKFIANPKAAVPGTAMGFAGIPKDSERADVIAYLNSLSDSPKPLPTAAK